MLEFSKYKKTRPNLKKSRSPDRDLDIRHQSTVNSSKFRVVKYRTYTYYHTPHLTAHPVRYIFPLTQYTGIEDCRRLEVPLSRQLTHWHNHFLHSLFTLPNINGSMPCPLRQSDSPLIIPSVHHGTHKAGPAFVENRTMSRHLQYRGGIMFMDQHSSTIFDCVFFAAMKYCLVIGCANDNANVA